jgi:hypothetical protein
MKNQNANQSMYQFLRTELRLLLILIAGIAGWTLVSSYFGYRTPDLFSWEYILGFMIAYPFISFINRRYLKL